MTIGENTRKDIAKTVGSATTVIEAAVDFIVENIDWNLTEHDLSEFIVGRFLMGNKRLAQPRVAFNANSLRSDYASRADAADSIRREGWLLIGVEPVTRQRPEGVVIRLRWSGWLSWARRHRRSRRVCYGN